MNITADFSESAVFFYHFSLDKLLEVCYNKPVYVRRLALKKYIRMDKKMIIDSLDRLSEYAAVHPRFPRAFAYLQELLASNAPDGKHVLEGTEKPEEIFVKLMTGDVEPKEVARAETHDLYIDVQVILSGEELMSVPTVVPAVSVPYNAAKEYTLYENVSFDQCHNLLMKEGSFVIFFAKEFHAPSMAAGDHPTTVRKAVLKVLA